MTNQVALPTNLSVAVNSATVAALEHIIQGEGLTLTEAVRRLIGYGEVAYRAVADKGATIHITTTHQLILENVVPAA